MSDIVVAKFHDSEISKADDFNFAAQAVTDILSAVIDEAFDDVAASFVVAGMTVTQLASPSMNVAIKAGLAYSREEQKMLHLASDLNVSVSASHASMTRLDTLEIRLATLDFNSETRAFKDPATGAVSYAAVNTKKKVFLEARCLAGTPGAGVAPAAESGWMKLAEIQVLNGTTTIINANIRNITAQEDGSANAAWTAETTKTFHLGSVEELKNMVLAHIANNITSGNTVHGIRQGHGNGFDADKLDGIESARVVYGDNSYKYTDLATADLDTVLVSGFYYAGTGCTNKPGTNAGQVLVIGINANYAVQLFWTLGSNSTYIRNKNSGTWGSWYKLWNEANDGSGSGLDADLWDGFDMATANTTTGAKFLAHLLTLAYDQRGQLIPPKPSDAALVGAWPCDSLPDWPDNPSGIFYLQTAWATADSWSASRATGAVSGGEYVLTSNGNANPCIYRYFTAIGTKTVRLRVRRIAGTTATGVKLFWYTGGTSGNSAEKPFTVPVGAWQDFDFSIDAGANTTLEVTMVSAATSTDVFGFRLIYAGDGSYASKLLDLSGRGNHATAYGAMPVAGSVGRALSFDGVNDYVKIPAPGCFGVGAITVIEARVTPLSATQGYVFAYGDTANSNRFYLTILSGTLLRFMTNTGTILDISCATGETAHVILVRDNAAGTMTAYKNGILVGSTSTTPPTADTNIDFYLGALSGSSQFAACVIDGLKISQGAITAADAYGAYRESWIADCQKRAVTQVPNSLAVRDTSGLLSDLSLRGIGIDTPDLMVGSLDNYTTGGLFKDPGNITNSPWSGVSGSIVLVMPYSSTYTVQFAANVSATGRIKSRAKVNGVWSAWSTVWTSGFQGSGSGLDADTVDGIESARILYGDGARGTALAADADAIAKSGFWMVTGTNCPTAATYNIIHIQSQDFDTRATQIAVRAAVTTVEMWARQKNSGTWGAWVKVWNADNDGSGSGLDADTVDGKHFTTNSINLGTLTNHYNLPALAVGEVCFCRVYGRQGSTAWLIATPSTGAHRLISVSGTADSADGSQKNGIGGLGNYTTNRANDAANYSIVSPVANYYFSFEIVYMRVS